MPISRTTALRRRHPGLLLLAVAACWTSLPARPDDLSAPDPDQPPLRVTAGVSSTWDDNLTRAPAADKPASDQITRFEAGLGARRVYGPQDVDADVTVARSLYRSHASEDFTAVGAHLGVGTQFGRDTALRLQYRQTQDLLPLENFQSLVRDVLTVRTLGLAARHDFGTPWKLNADIEHGWSTNDAPLYAYNDFQSNAASVAVTRNLSPDSHVGLRVKVAASQYAHASGGTAAGTPSFTDHRLEPFALWTPTTGIQLRADLAVVDRSYPSLPGQDLHSAYGKLAADYDRGGRLTGGIGVQRELGGTLFLASRIVESDGLLAHLRYVLTAGSTLEGSFSAIRRRYSVDQPGYPAHRDYGNLVDLAWTGQVRRGLDLRLDWTGDWRRSNPTAFAYTDHRIMLALRFQP